MSRIDNIYLATRMGFTKIINQLSDLDDTKLNELVQVSLNSKKIKDGIEYAEVQDFRIVLSDKTQSEKDGINSFFSNAKSLVLAGDWQGAKTDIDSRTPNEFVDQELYNEIKGFIDQYVIDHY